MWVNDDLHIIPKYFWISILRSIVKMWIVYYYHLQLGNYSCPYAVIVGNFYVCKGNILGLGII